MDLYEKLLAGEEKLSLVGLGYVGMPIAVAYAKKIKVVGYDFNAQKVELYKKGIDPTREVGNDAIKETTVEFTADPEKLRECKFHVVAVQHLLMMITHQIFHLLREQATHLVSTLQRVQSLYMSQQYILELQKISACQSWSRSQALSAV
jgi:UDP-N-acetyl-D-mannosaminuronate dehydrogenase